jgi:hypothetical protein
MAPVRSGSKADRLPITSGTSNPPATHKYARAPSAVPPTRNSSPGSSVNVTPGAIIFPLRVLWKGAPKITHAVG